MDIQTSGLLFELVQLLHVFDDSKTFPDAVPRDGTEPIREDVDKAVMKCAQSLHGISSDPENAESVLKAARLLHKLRCELEQIVQRHFTLPGEAQGTVPHSDSMEQHIERMWDWLTRRPGDTPEQSNLLPLNHPYVVPGGRYVEFYYWDSYFTSVGLLASGRIDLLQSMVDNAADLIGKIGFVPNGNRSYYLTRSQAPYFCHMLRLLGKAKGEPVARSYYDILKKEYGFWERDDSTRLVKLAGGQALNRYWDSDETPRPEGYREDLNTWYGAHSSGLLETEKHRIFRDLRAAAESGWDFSSRWLNKDAEGKWNLSSIRTTSILPIDLNCLVYSMERQLAQWAPTEGDRHDFLARSDRRRKLVLNTPFWDNKSGWFFDAERVPSGDLTATGVESLAGVFPLFCEVAGRHHADEVARRIETGFLKAGGVVTTTQAFHTGQQWDYPNGWAPLQWVTVAGLVNYGYEDLAKEIARRFVEQARKVYDRSGKMMEKYDVCDLTRAGGGGEYLNQDGFGWTNAVVKAFIEFLNGNVFWR